MMKRQEIEVFSLEINREEKKEANIISLRPFFH